PCGRAQARARGNRARASATARRRAVTSRRRALASTRTPSGGPARTSLGSVLSAGFGASAGCHGKLRAAHASVVDRTARYGDGGLLAQDPRGVSQRAAGRATHDPPALADMKTRG